MLQNYSNISDMKVMIGKNDFQSTIKVAVVILKIQIVAFQAIVVAVIL